MDISHLNFYRIFLNLSFLNLSFILGCGSVFAAPPSYPDHPVTLVVPSTPGGGTDTSSRLLIPKISEILGQPIVIINRPGASGNIGAASVASSTADGYTLLTLISSNVINPNLYQKVGYDIEKDFTPISRTVTVQGVLVSNQALPANNLQELITYLKANPNKINYGSGGTGSFSHLMMELFQINAGIKLLHVPYKATSPAFTDVLANHVSLMIVDIALALPYIKNGSLKAYGVTSNKRSLIAPDIPTLSESGMVGLEGVQWFGLVAPAKLPKPILDKLFQAVHKTLSDPEIQATLAKEGMNASPSASPDEFNAFMKSETIKWSKVIKDAKIERE